jgi:hypothetical protein
MAVGKKRKQGSVLQYCALIIWGLLLETEISTLPCSQDLLMRCMFSPSEITHLRPRAGACQPVLHLVPPFSTKV